MKEKKPENNIFFKKKKVREEEKARRKERKKSVIHKLHALIKQRRFVISLFSKKCWVQGS